MLWGIISSKSRDRKICFSYVKVGWGRKVGYVEIPFQESTHARLSQMTTTQQTTSIYFTLFRVLETQKMMLFLHSHPTLLMS